MEQYSIDEAFVDMTSSCHLFVQPEDVAKQIKDQIRERLGFTVNVRVSGNKLLAKMASDFKKPDRVHTLYPEEIQRKMWVLPVSDLFFVGRATTKKLLDMGIKTIGELAAADPVWLKSILKKQGEVIWGFANGVDLSPVLAQPVANKGYGNFTTTPYDVTDVETADRVLLALAEISILPNAVLIVQKRLFAYFFNRVSALLPFFNRTFEGMTPADFRMLNNMD